MAAQGVVAYSQINATVRALYSKMIAPPIWEALIHAQDLNALLALLSKTVYGPYLQLKSELLTPRRIAYQIRGHLADIYAKLIRLSPTTACSVLSQLWQLYEVDNLKATLRGIETGASWDQVLHLLSPMSQHTVLKPEDLEKMLQSGTIEKAISHIAHTPYYDTLAHALERYQTEHSLFPLEVAIDLEYRRKLWKSIECLKGRDREQALHIIGTGLDSDNLLWAIRYRVYHGLSEQEIINYTLPYGYQLRDEDIRAIAAGKEIAPIIQRLYPELKARFQFESSTDLSAFELALQRHIVKTCHAAFRDYPFHIGVPIAYVWLNEHEIRDLTMIVEAKASRLPVETFISLLEMQPLSAQEARPALLPV